MASNKEAPMSTPIDPGPPFLLLFAETYIVTKGAPAVVFFFYFFFFFPTFTTAFTLSTLSTRWTRPELCRITRIGHGREPGETRPSRGAACLHTHTHTLQVELVSSLKTCQSFTATGGILGNKSRERLQFNIDRWETVHLPTQLPRFDCLLWDFGGFYTDSSVTVSFLVFR